MKYWIHKGTREPWQHKQHAVWIVEDDAGHCRFVSADGKDHSAGWPSDRIRSICLDGSSIQVWGLGVLNMDDPDLMVAEGL